MAIKNKEMRNSLIGFTVTISKLLGLGDLEKEGILIASDMGEHIRKTALKFNLQI
jgi:hypothetical protein